MALPTKPAHLGGLFKTITEVNLLRVAVTALQAQTAGAGVVDTRLDAAEASIVVLQQNAGEVAGVTDTGRTFLTKAIKRKILTLAAGPNASTVNTAHGVVPVRVLKVQVVAKNVGGSHLCFEQGGMLGDTLAHSITVAVDGTNVGLTSGAGGDYSGYAGYIVLEYTDA